MDLDISSFGQRKYAKVQCHLHLNSEEMFNDDFQYSDVMYLLDGVTQLLLKDDTADVSIPEPTPISHNNYIEIVDKVPLSAASWQRPQRLFLLTFSLCQ